MFFGLFEGPLKARRIWLMHDGRLSKASRNCENNSPPPLLYSTQHVAALA
jgi:hypothetical protein